MQERSVKMPPQMKMESPKRWLVWEFLSSGRSVVKVLNPRMSSNSVVVSVPYPPAIKMTLLAGAAFVVVVVV